MEAIGSGDKQDHPAPRRRRRTPTASRAMVLEAAQSLLVEAGPAGVTLKAVARATGMTHGNVTHHFGSSAQLQAALIGCLADRLSLAVAEATARLREKRIDEAQLVSMVFDAFAKTGAGRLLGVLSGLGRDEALAPIFAVLATCVAALRAGEPADTDQGRVGAGPAALAIVSLALIDSLIGERVTVATAMPRDGLKLLAAEQLRRLRAT